MQIRIGEGEGVIENDIWFFLCSLVVKFIFIDGEGDLGGRVLDRMQFSLLDHPSSSLSFSFAILNEETEWYNFR